MSSPEEITRTQLAEARARAARAEEEATRLALELDAANRRIADLEDFDFGGNTDPFIARLAVLKERVGKTSVGAKLAPLYRRLTGR